MSADTLRRAKRRRRYAEVPEALLFNPDISSHAKTVWGILDRHIDNRDESVGTETEGVAFPSRAKLAGYMGVALDTVDRALAELRLAGWLSTTHRGQGRTALSELYDEPDAAQARLQETARVRRQEAARVRSPKRNGPKDNEQKGTTPPPPVVEQPPLLPATPLRTSSSEQQFTKQPTTRTRPRANQRSASGSAPDLASDLARAFTRDISPCLSNNVRRLTSDIRLLLKDWTPEQIEAAARHPETLSWTFNALAFRLKQTAAVVPSRPSRPAVPPPPPPSPEERAAVLAAMRKARAS